MAFAADGIVSAGTACAIRTKLPTCPNLGAYTSTDAFGEGLLRRWEKREALDLSEVKIHKPPLDWLVLPGLFAGGRELPTSATRLPRIASAVHTWIAFIPRRVS